VTDGGGDGPAGEVRVGDLDPVVELVDEAVEPAAEDDPDPGLDVGPLADPIDSGFDAHAEPSATRLWYLETTSSTACAGSSLTRMPAKSSGAIRPSSSISSRTHSSISLQ
jgi:hypothetical protein